MDEFLWVEKYRPQTVQDCIIPETAKKIFQECVDTGEIQNFLLSGPAGVGKTTVAQAMCKQIGLNYMFINASEERGIDTLRTKIMDYASTISFTGGRKVIILDEADGITPEAQHGLRGVIESFSDNCTFIFTCNYKSKIIDALQSRCALVDFTLRGNDKVRMAADFYKRCAHILTEENIKFDRNVLAEIVKLHFPDFRRVLNELQKFSRAGDIDAGVLASIAGVQNISNLMTHLKEKDFGAMRKWVVDNGDVDQTRIFRAIYDSLNEYLTPETIPQAIIILSRYQYQAAFVSDHEINLVACLTELMVDTELR
jgi:DNA polymerase III delta prime subunit